MSEYSFEKKSIVVLSMSLFVLLILVYFLGLLTGLGIDRSESKSVAPMETAKTSEQSMENTQLLEAGNSKSHQSDLSKETEPKPVTPDFKEVSPQSEQPRISQPKKE